MASRTVSPGGALLRSSRMFAMPAPLPRPVSKQSTGLVYDSDTATTWHPTHLAVTTPATSLAAGDWGLKRPLPLRSTTRTSTPIMKIGAIDTWEHITEFKSASDHALSLEKFQEMDVTITVPSPSDSTTMTNKRKASNKSVFEKEFDAITNGPDRAVSTRWKFDGPWLAGMTEVGFNEYLQNVVRRRKNEFQQYLKGHLVQKMNSEAATKADQDGVAAPEPIKIEDITEEQMLRYNRELRADRRHLMHLLRIFLDLPPPPPTVDDKSWLSMFNSSKSGETTSISMDDYVTQEESPFSKSGPPKTHPSAGLSYNRTSAHIFNHPLYGPQEHHAPVEARALVPRNSAGGGFRGAKLGVGGFVTPVPVTMDYYMPHRQGRYGNANRGPPPGILYFEPDKEGGSKVWVHPNSAIVNSEGAVELEVVTGDGQAVTIKTESNEKLSGPSVNDGSIKWFTAADRKPTPEGESVSQEL